ncbi:hypothetical protein Tam1G_2053 [Bifidobacterium imperatoris]|uniref:Uncharacterized protein n=1 Tax=Bifidobacterium imperatoris TaxID=2020965 RepID=A0A2N5IPM8_9BIFI|nr:hypothetical protein Tam1G_2053 [Bifidobacterium imperatoris]
MRRKTPLPTPHSRKCDVKPTVKPTPYDAIPGMQHKTAIPATQSQECGTEGPLTTHSAECITKQATPPLSPAHSRKCDAQHTPWRRNLGNASQNEPPRPSQRRNHRNAAQNDTILTTFPEMRRRAPRPTLHSPKCDVKPTVKYTPRDAITGIQRRTAAFVLHSPKCVAQRKMQKCPLWRISRNAAQHSEHQLINIRYKQNQ